MRVILLQNIKGFGQIGDIKNVSDGHARNFLFPRKMAKPASVGAEKEVAEMNKQKAQTNEKESVAANAALAALNSTTISLNKKASSSGTLFSSITKDEVSKELTHATGFKIDKSMIDFGSHGEHIKHLGKHEIAVNLSESLKATVELEVK